jgi:SAM-dependent methyltransferase
MPEAPFDHVTAEYERGRSAYPDGVFAAVEQVAGPLRGQVVIEGGAGTGIATRQLAARGARLVAFDISGPMLSRARRPDEPPLVVADGATLPFRSETADVVCFAQAWHWLDAERASAEAARVLRPGGTWAAWWSHFRADGQPWFDSYLALVENGCPGHHWGWRDHPWGDTLTAGDRFSTPGVAVVRWDRTMTVEGWLVEERSRSNIAAMPAPDRDALLDDIRALLVGWFGDTAWTVPYDTRVWTARRMP